MNLYPVGRWTDAEGYNGGINDMSQSNPRSDQFPLEEVASRWNVGSYGEDQQQPI